MRVLERVGIIRLAGLRARFFNSRSVPLLIISITSITVLALSATSHAVTLISQAYTADAALAAGTIVSLKKDSTTNIEPTTVENVNGILGVVIGKGNSQVSLSSAAANQVQVGTSNVEQVLVSDINGKISPGDQITASPISGVGMKATGSVKVLGVAQDTFPNKTSTDQSYTDQNKQKKSVKIGQVPVLISVAFYYKQPDKTLIPQALQNLANSLAGKTVNSLPIILSVVIFIITLIIVVSIIYSMIHSSIISVGRNPMSQAAVYRNVIQLSTLVVIILGVSVGSIYMILTRL